MFAFIGRHRGEYGIEFLCRQYGVSKSGYYASQRRAPSARAEANHTLLQRIECIHRRSHGTYGSPRVVQALRKEGLAANKKRVARLMRTAGLKGRVVKVTRRAPGVHRFFEATDNLRVATAPPTAPNQQWVGDVTYLKANGRPCFLAVIMDVYSRRIVGWAVGLDRTVNLTALAMRRAIRNRGPAQALIFHSDRGIEYAAYRYRAILTQYGIRPSMNRPRYCQDNAHMESFFHTMKTEWIRGRTFASFAELEAALTAYIRFYNHYRLHSGIDYCTPEEYERLMA
ncbi:MAG: IS3 family transposase [candidate division NC10 bacterium]|nr:IS3 family transposase [candidate division NC10 bacterium]